MKHPTEEEKGLRHIFSLAGHFKHSTCYSSLPNQLTRTLYAEHKAEPGVEAKCPACQSWVDWKVLTFGVMQAFSFEYCSPFPFARSHLINVSCSRERVLLFQLPVQGQMGYCTDEDCLAVTGISEICQKFPVTWLRKWKH
ncbi:hypothetical protein Y1Q_0008709 [Alligator mississippiensis]|uniref:Uncharacterized protein n=1 Tax=Alligator mississippiensis TaxID=8496 RepID=A0A151NAJ2_ALLMI|nr:hypothetical protein Y1Q_0008709 [Alligator mississippiensis]